MRRKVVKHRAVIDRKQGQEISQEPEMQELTRLYKDMTGQEKERTVEYLNEKASPSGKSQSCRGRTKTKGERDHGRGKGTETDEGDGR